MTKLLSMICILSLIFNRQENKVYVPNEATAIKIAEAIWLPIYGKDIYLATPFKAVLKGDTAWQVFGTLPESAIKVNSDGDTIYVINSGGVPQALIDKRDGKIYYVSHSK